MINRIEKNSEWYMVIIYDVLALPGKSIHDIVNLLLKSVNIQYVFLSDVEGSGTKNLIKETPVLPLRNFLTYVLSVEQFDWGDFFLFKNFPQNWQTFKGKSYPDIIVLTEITIRAVDDSYIYIYTSYEKVVQLLKNNYVIEEVKKKQLIDLDYPY